MVTDTQRIKRTDPGRPEVCNVCQLHRFFGPTTTRTIWDGERTARTGLRRHQEAARRSDARATSPRPASGARELESKPDYVEEVLRAGADKLAPMAPRPCARSTNGWASGRP